MARAVDVGDAQAKRGVVRLVLVGFVYILILALAILGAILLGLETFSWLKGERWKPEDINILIAAESPARRIVNTVWQDTKYLIQYGAYFIAAVALALATAQIKTVAKLISDFLVARGPIYQLAATMTNAEESARRLAQQVDRLSGLEPTIQSTAEKIEEALKRLGDLERLTVSERTDAPTEAQAPAPASGTPPAPADVSDPNWERLRELWNANGRRLDEVIERIPDKRTRNKFSRMSRHNYAGIIERLAEEGLISEAAKKASLDLHKIFMSYKPRNRKIRDDTVQAMEVFDGMLEKELAPQPVVDTPVQGSAHVENSTTAPV